MVPPTNVDYCNQDVVDNPPSDQYTTLRCHRSSPSAGTTPRPTLTTPSTPYVPESLTWSLPHMPPGRCPRRVWRQQVGGAALGWMHACRQGGTQEGSGDNRWVGLRSVVDAHMQGEQTTVYRFRSRCLHFTLIPDNAGPDSYHSY